MPRNSSGTYSLYTPGNPVVTSTVISSTWANNSLADIASALTDSLSRTGDGGMQAPLELDDGAIGAPALTWGTETTSGWYRQASGNFRFSIAATDRLALSATGLSITGSIITSTATGGSQGAGTINATGVYDDGILLANQTGANPTGTIGLTAVNGSAGTFLRSDGAPALSQAIVPTWSGQHQWALALWAPDGSAGTVSYGFASDSGKDTGMYLGGTDVVSFSSGGTQSLRTSNGRTYTGDGSEGFPSWSFISATTTGFYRPAGTDVWMSLGGTGFPVGYRNIPRSTTATTLAAGDLGKCVAVSAAIAIPASVFSAGDALSIYNDSGSSINITIAAGTLRLAGTTTTGTRALAARGIATIWFNVGGATPEVIASGPGVS